MGKINCVFYLTNILATEERPFELYCNEESVLTYQKHITIKELYIVEKSVDADDEGTIEITFRVPCRRVDHTQQFTITKDLVYFLLCLDSEKKQIVLNQQYLEIDDEILKEHFMEAKISDAIKLDSN
jgi:hypothetical protein